MGDPMLHPTCAHIAFLLGTWRGEGTGRYPTIDDFNYREEVVFSHIGKPFLRYEQKTWGEDGAPMHSEVGFWRPQPNSRIEIVLSHSFGAAEIQEGTVVGQTIDLESKAISATSSAKRIDQTRRRYRLEEGALSYSLDMAAVGQPLAAHLEARLERVP